MKQEDIWSTLLNICKKDLSKQQYSTWIKPLDGKINNTDNNFIISAPNQFVLQWVKERLNDKFIEIIKNTN